MLIRRASVIQKPRFHLRFLHGRWHFLNKRRRNNKRGAINVIRLLLEELCGSWWKRRWLGWERTGASGRLRHQYLRRVPPPPLLPPPSSLLCYKLSKWSMTGLEMLNRPLKTYGAFLGAVQAVTRTLLFSSARSIWRKWMALSFSPAQYYSLPFSKQYHNISWCNVKMAQIGPLKYFTSAPLSLKVSLTADT